MAPSPEAQPIALGVAPGVSRQRRSTNPILLPTMIRSPLTYGVRSEEHTSELQSRLHLVCRLLLEKKKKDIGQPFISVDTEEFHSNAASPIFSSTLHALSSLTSYCSYVSYTVNTTSSAVCTLISDI